ncbi:calcium:proton antiporter [Nitratireductor kimnyeongensis]|uniref:Calcium:proton antiporter n=1 Tax=Nitratireductor kimnyeongensis TaxID=430679 RepID=A0ABW0TDB2_9HYPH|nr:ionic transporter y4hA [Nitratireductor kimnyeongensis]QZZ36940.1 ionic transporter y4hA [Nitratireductor kimnyeongensis]
MTRNQIWTFLAPVVALGFALFIEHLEHDAVSGVLLMLAAPLLLLAVFSAVHHAELVSHKIGQPFGSILLALAVTVIEVSLIVSVLIADPSGDSPVARDTVFAAIMIVLNGIVGLCLLVGGIRYHEQGFQGRGATAALGVLGTLAVLGLVLPNFTVERPGPVYAPAQLVFVAIVSLSLYALFLFVQMFKHKDDFLDASSASSQEHAGHAEPVPARTVALSAIMLPVALVAVVMLAETLAAPVDAKIEAAGLPDALLGVVIALMVLLPEGVASIRAAMQNHIQTSLNLALGSALASLCLTIPTVAVISVMQGKTLILGLAAEHMVLLLLTLFMSTLSLATGRTTMMQGGIHLVIFAAFIAISILP